MTLQISIQEQYINKFKDFLNSLPNGAIEIKRIAEDNYITLEEAEEKVKKSLNEIALNKGISIDEAFSKVLKY